MKAPTTWLTKLPREGKYNNMIISKEENLEINSEIIRIMPDQKYVLKTTATCKQGIPNVAYLCAITLDKDKKEIDRKIRWINDFSGNPIDYSIIFKTIYGAAYAVVGFRVNTENQINNLEPTTGTFQITLPSVSLLRLEKADKYAEEQYDHLIAPAFDPLTEEENSLERKIAEMPITWLTKLPRDGKTTMMISKEENLMINSEIIRVKPDQKYVLKATATCKQGISNSAHLCVIILDKDMKEIDRKIRWINDFSGNPIDYSIIFKTIYGAAYAVVGFRVNTENQINNLEPTTGTFQITLPSVSLLRLEKDDKHIEEEYDHLIAPPFNPLTEEEENSLERKIMWVFGSPRSGSTWLSAGLLDHEQNIMWDEPFVGYHIMHLYESHEKRNDFFYSPVHKHSWQKLLRKMILSRTYSQARTLTKNVIVKEPNSSSGADFVMNCFPNSKLLFLLRDGRDVVDSQIDAHNPDSWNSELSQMPLADPADRLESIKEYSETWRFFTEVVLDAYNKHNPSLRLLVKYEDLRKDTVKQLQRIYDFLNIKISEETLERIVEKNRFENIKPELRGSGKFHRFATPGKWKENFSDGEKHVMEQIMGNTLQKLGY